MPRKRRVLSQEILIAYHEAGHTVMALAWNERVLVASIVPMPQEKTAPADHSGLTRYHRKRVQFKHGLWIIPKPLMVPACDVALNLAGLAAAQVYRGRSDLRDFLHAANDFDRSRQTLQALRDEGCLVDIDKTINRILRGVLRITRLPHYQYVLTAFVAALLEKKILRRGELEQLYLQKAGEARADKNLRVVSQQILRIHRDCQLVFEHTEPA